MESIVNSAKYLLDLGMENNIAIGSDFDGADMSVNLCKTAHVSNLYTFFCNSGLKKSTVDKIFYKNAYNYIANLR